MIRQRVWITLTTALCILLIGAFSSSFAGEGEAKLKPVAVTTIDPEVPVEELVLMIKPLTKQELLVEAEAWQALLKEIVIEISKAEIVVKRQNREIEKSKQIQEKAEEAKEQLEEVKAKAEEVKVSGDAVKIQETEEAAREAQETMREIKDSVEEAAEAAEKTAEVKEHLDTKTEKDLNETTAAADKAQDALDRVQELAEDVDTNKNKSAREAAGQAREATAQAEQAIAETRDKVEEVAERVQESDAHADVVDETAAAMEQAEEDKMEKKVEMLENVNELREERTYFIDRLNSVLDELETKTDKDDNDTLAKIKDYRLYISSVRGIQVDVQDTTSAWIAIKGWLTSQEGGIRWAKNIAIFIGIIFIAWLLSKILSRAVSRGLDMMENVSQLLEDFLVGTVRWLVMISGIIMALASLEVSIGPLLAIVGAAGFVIAFALQSSLSNFASGIMILFFRPFDMGDVVEAGGVSGKVISMNLVATTIKTFDNKDMVVPNNKIWNGVITNATGVDTRRVDMEFGIGYANDIDKAQAILEEIVAHHPKTLHDPAPTIRVNTLLDSSIKLICRPWSKTADYWDVYWDVTELVKKRFEAEGIGIPSPRQDVHLHIEDSETKQSLAGLSR